MGRKKRKAGDAGAAGAAAVAVAVAVPVAVAVAVPGYGYPPPPPGHGPPPGAFPPGGGTVPPHHQAPPLLVPPVGAPAGAIANATNKRSRNGSPTNDNADGERYLVKKYRPDTYYRSIEAFARYTKAHRMSDSAYVRLPPSQGYGSPDKPFVFMTRIGGQPLSWGQGKTRDAAIDCACRAAFMLVNAHGYQDFSLDEDCFTSEPMRNPVMLGPPPGSLPPPPPPPPPPPMPGHLPPPPPAAFGGGIPPPLPPGLPPPPGAVAGLPPPPPPGAVPLIPQPAAPSTSAPVASAVAQQPPAPSSTIPAATAIGSVGQGLTLSLTGDTSTAAGTSSGNGNATSSSISPRKKLKGGLTLVFEPDDMDEGDDTPEETKKLQRFKETCMEERRAGLARYRTLLGKALSKRRSS